jgi:hypothetical protein
MRAARSGKRWGEFNSGGYLTAGTVTEINGKRISAARLVGFKDAAGSLQALD